MMHVRGAFIQRLYNSVVQMAQKLIAQQVAMLLYRWATRSAAPTPAPAGGH